MIFISAIHNLIGIIASITIGNVISIVTNAVTNAVSMAVSIGGGRR